MILRRVVEHFRKQEWTAIGIDFVIVVFGVFFGIQVANWNETRQDRAREHVYLKRIAAELEDSIRDIERSHKLAQSRQDTGRFLIAAASDEAPVRANPGKFIAAIYGGAWTYSPPIRSYAFDELRSAGNLDLIEDKALLVAITGFYTEVAEKAQWNYIRELNQTEYMKRAAGILSYEQMALIDANQNAPDVSVDEALVTRARMLERPGFVEWLPNVAYRFEEIDTLRETLEQAHSVHVVVTAHLRAAGAE
jgi:hypothetical protein